MTLTSAGPRNSAAPLAYLRRRGVGDSAFSVSPFGGASRSRVGSAWHLPPDLRGSEIRAFSLWRGNTGESPTRQYFLVLLTPPDSAAFRRMGLCLMRGLRPLVALGSYAHSERSLTCGDEESPITRLPRRLLFPQPANRHQASPLQFLRSAKVSATGGRNWRDIWDCCRL